MSVAVTRRVIEITHVVIRSTKSFAAVRDALDLLVPRLDPELAPLIADDLTERLKQRLEAAAVLSIFAVLNHGVVLGIYGKPRNAIQYIIGNPLTASTMTRYTLAAGLYAPLRVILFETDDGGSCFQYDLPSSLFSQFGDERITKVGRSLDVELAKALSAAAA